MCPQIGQIIARARIKPRGLRSGSSTQARKKIAKKIALARMSGHRQVASNEIK